MKEDGTCASKDPHCNNEYTSVHEGEWLHHQYCLKCEGGFAFDINQICVQCTDTNCSDCCDTVGTCNACNADYQLNDARICVKCGDDCAECSMVFGKCKVC